MKATTLTDQIERDVQIAGQEYAQHMLQVFEAMGDRPMFARRVTDDENLRYYLHMRNDPLAWKSMIEQQGMAKAAAFGVAMDKLLAKAATNAP